MNMNRRTVLGLAATGAGMLATAKGSTLLLGSRPGAPARTVHAAQEQAAFIEPLPIPQQLRPVASIGGVDVFRVEMRPADVSVLPGLSTPALTYNGTFVGPTIRARRGHPAVVQVTNSLDMPANVHLHGGHTPAASDGYPTDVVEAGSTRLYHYPNTQPGATLWYHDHAHGMEAEDVYRGLHGFYIIDDDAERGLQLPSGAYDVPVMLRDAAFTADGALRSDTFDRPVILANGKQQPYFKVAARKYRLRLLNAANTRVFRLTVTGAATLTQIGADGGLLPAPVSRTEIVLSSAERQDVVVDFTHVPVGSSVLLNDGTAGAVLRFDVVRGGGDPSRVPAVLRPAAASAGPSLVRDVGLGFNFATGAGQINGQAFDAARVDFRVAAGSTEIWRISNLDPAGIDHTFHMHATHFTVLDRDGAAPTADDAGLKDTIYVPSGAKNIRVQATFGNLKGRYVYHCHFLEHSAAGMMAVMEIV